MATHKPTVTGYRSQVTGHRLQVKPETCDMRPASRKSVTLIELVMVIVLVGILALVTIPRFGSFYFLKFTATMKKTASDIRYIQQLAVSRHNDTRIEFDATANSYQSCYCNEPDGACATGSCGSATNWSWITDPFTRGNLQLNFNSDPQYGGIDISAVDFGGTSTLRFNWQGLPQNANGTNLSSEGTVSFSYKGNTNTISVTPNTGRVRVQ